MAEESFFWAKIDVASPGTKPESRQKDTNQHIHFRFGDWRVCLYPLCWRHRDATGKKILKNNIDV